MGGIAGWQDELGGLDFVGLNKKNSVLYPAAAAIAGKPNAFRIHVPKLSPAPYLMTMFGTLTTDGTIGALSPQNIIFTDPMAPNGFANYYMGNFGVMGEKTPLVARSAATYPVTAK
jgi:hypothetical protein